MPALKQDTPKKAAPKQKAVHPVQPAKGELGYAKMRKDIIESSPKTLARLAE